MSQASFIFAKNNPCITENQLANMEIFKISCTVFQVKHGDLNDHGRTFIIAALSEEQARVWVEYNFLTCSSALDYEEMTSMLTKDAYSLDTDEYFSMQLEGSINVGDYQYRSLDSMEKISQSDAENLILRSVCETNIHFTIGE